MGEIALLTGAWKLDIPSRYLVVVLGGITGRPPCLSHVGSDRGRWATDTPRWPLRWNSWMICWSMMLVVREATLVPHSRQLLWDDEQCLHKVWPHGTSNIGMCSKVVCKFNQKCQQNNPRNISKKQNNKKPNCLWAQTEHCSDYYSSTSLQKHLKIVKIR